ncbi:hypothetical protein JB92DRAFT_2900438 [Gautieria morchelliformis]|nr:hypothetical protein JB92DRAFT_2900438 [Gautieria morchelliformis]
MPKSSKKKKDKTADFSKAKLKLGKGKQVANNATDTTFKARSIAVPYQTIGQEKDASKPTTRRNLSLDDLLLHLKHYNPTTRKDAIWGIRELLDTNPQLMGTSLTPVIQACARIVGDEDAEVRKSLLTFLAWLFRLAPLHKIRPHVPLLILFITSAQTHIFPAIRIDAIRFIDLLLDHIPEIVTQVWNEPQSTGARVLEGYLGLLNAGSFFWAGHKDDAPAPSSSSVTLSSNSKHAVLSSLSSFLRKAISSPLSQSESASVFWFMASSFTTHTEFLSFCSLIHPRHDLVAGSSTNETEWSHTIRQFNPEDFVGVFDCALGSRVSNEFSLSELGGVGQAVDMLKSDFASTSQSSSTTSRMARLAHTLHPILVSTWLDVAPSVFVADASGDETSALLAISVAQIAGCLYGTIFRDVDLAGDVRSIAFNDLTALLGYMSTYLPCISQTGKTQSEEVSRDLSFAYCELTSLAVLASQYYSTNAILETNPSAKPEPKQTKALSIQADRVGEYVVKALEGELKTVSQPLGHSLTASAYTMLLPTIWSFLRYQSTVESVAISSRIRLACINHALRVSSKSGAKGVATQFIGLMVLLHSQRNSHMTLTANELERFRGWIQQLPKVLWEVGGRDPSLTETILRILLHIALRRSALFDAATSGYVRSRLIPYFATIHPEKGEILGPFTKLKQWPRLRRLALNVTAVLMRDSETSEPIRAAVDRAVKYTEDAQYWCTRPDSI